MSPINWSAAEQDVQRRKAEAESEQQRLMQELIQKQQQEKEQQEREQQQQQQQEEEQMLEEIGAAAVAELESGQAGQPFTGNLKFRTFTSTERNITISNRGLFALLKVLEADGGLAPGADERVGGDHKVDLADLVNSLAIQEMARRGI